ncbi:MAG: cytochrome P450 [Catenulispora sp.]
MTPALEYPSAADHAGDLPPALAGPHSGPLPRVRLPDGRTAWLVTRYADVRTVLDGEGFTRDLPRPDGPAQPQAPDSPQASQTPQTPQTAPPPQAPVRTVNSDGPAHLELRAVVSKPFTVRRIKALAPRVQEVTDRLLDAMVAAGQPADLAAAVAGPLPAILICDLLGLPDSDHAKLTAWCDRITVTAPGGPDPAAWSELGGFLAAAALAKRAEPAAGRAPDADILSSLIHAHDAGTLSMPELVGLAVVVLAGGLETTRTAIGAGLLRLFREPGQWEKLRADPDLVDGAVEEILRYQPVIDINRVQSATRDVRLGGRDIKAGDLVQICVNAANRDESVFPGGSAFDLTRAPGPHLAFGHGAHHCLGAALARLELRTVFSTLLRRLPGLAPAAAPEDLRWRGGHVTVGLPELPVTW